MFQQNSDMFSFEDSCFAVQKSKESCGRIVMWKEFNLINSFTLEASFMGPNRGSKAGLHFNTTHLRQIGKDFCKTLVDFQRDAEKVQTIANELKVRYPQGGTSGGPGADFMLEQTATTTPAATAHPTAQQPNDAQPSGQNAPDEEEE